MSIPGEPVKGDIVIENTRTWIFANTGLKDGDHLPGILGYEVDALYNDATTPANTIDVAHSPFALNGRVFTADSTVYRATSGAWVFTAGSIEWDYGLSNISPRGPKTSAVNPRTQQITRNILDRFISAVHRSPQIVPAQGWATK